MAEEAEDVGAVVKTEGGGDGVADAAAQGEGGEEFFPGILHGTRGHQERNKRERRGQKSGDGDGEETPAFEGAGDLAGAAFGEFALHGLFTALAGQIIGDETADHCAERGHEGVVGPGVTMTGGQPDGEDVHAAGEGDDGIIGDAQYEQAGPAHAAQLAPEGHG